MRKIYVRLYMYFSHNSSGDALFGLSWTCVVLIEIYKNKTQVSQDDLKQLVSS
jgi:hypothetical protein